MEIMGFDIGALEKVIKAVAILVIGYGISRLASSVVSKVVGKDGNPHLERISKKSVSYIIIAIALITALDLFIPVGTLLAAAGIAGIAIGMAAQRSVSNIISGLFLLADQPFEIGDAVDVGGDAGVVIDVSLFSTRLRTFDNKHLRIPNDTVANAKIINLTNYDLRRMDLQLGVAYKEDVGKALEIVKKVVNSHKLVLAEPEPQVLVTGFGDSSINMEVRAWVQRIDLFLARTEVIQNIKKALDEAGIEIPFPHRTIYLGAGEIEKLKDSSAK